jgi:Tol biopolymer transport system component
MCTVHMARAVIAAVAAGAAASAGLGGPLGTESIAYLRLTHGAPQIYRLDVGRHVLSQVTRPPAYMSVASFSFAPDVREFVFDGIHRGSPLGLLIADATGATRVLTRNSFDSSPRWSPDGRWIAFSRQRDPKHFTTIDLYAIRPNGAGLRRLTFTTGADLSPAWSPASRTVVFQNGGRLATIGITGGPVQRLDIKGTQSSWSPDGSELAFAVPSGGGRSPIWAAKIDGSDARVVDDGGSGVDSSPSWSADGSEIFFSSTRTDRGDIYAARADGSDLRQVTSSVDREESVAVLR